jgi:adenylate cyclase
MLRIGKEKLGKAAIALSIAALAVILTQDLYFSIGPLNALRQSFIDERFSDRGALSIKDRSSVVIVEITRNTHEGIPAPYNTWPFARFIFAKLIKNLSDAGAKAIGIDIVMSAPDKNNPQYDSLMIDAIRNSGKVVVAGKIEEMTGNVTIQNLSEDFSVSVSGPSFQITRANEDFSNYYYQADSSIGIVQVIGDNDGVYRRYLPFMYSTSADRLVPTFGFALLNKYFGFEKDYLAKINNEEFVLGDIKIPKFDNVSMLINYYGPDGTFPKVDFIDVIDDAEFQTSDEIDLETEINTWDDPEYGLKFKNFFKDKIVLIGSTQPEDKDILPVAFAKGEKTGDNNMYGVELHANAIQNIINQDFLYKLPQKYEILILVFLTLLSFYLSSFFKSIKTKYGIFLEFANLLVIGLILLGIRYFSYSIFENSNFIFPIINPSLTVVLGYFGSTAYHFITERKQKAMIKGMFSQYVNATVVNDIVSHPDKLKLGGERKSLSVFFSDIAGFSTFSETKDPAELVSFLNEYLGEMTKIIFENKGTLDKYIGDAVMAFWGAPIPFENHASLTCTSALKMQARLAEMRKKWESEGQTVIDIRMGINSGDMIVGNMGGKERFDYTVMGDNVNLASRLEGANKEYGTRIMISEMTHDIVKDDFFTRELDVIVVKGKTKPIRVFELLGNDEFPPSEIQKKSFAIYCDAMKEYKNKNFSKAISLFGKALEINPSDGPSKVYIKRCELFLVTPPPADWDGVFIMKTK